MSKEFRHQASLALNIILAVTAIVLIAHGFEAPPAKTVSVNTATEKQSSAAKPVGPRYPEAMPATDQRRWLVDQLRGMGVPNNVLARIVLADLDWAWNKRGGEVSLKSHGDPATMAALKLENAMSLDGEMRAALGEEGFRQWDYQNMAREANRGKIPLTSAEADASYDLWKKLQQHELDLRKAVVKGEMDDADANAEYAKAASDFAQQMKSLLGDERYAISQSLDGSAAASLRQDLANANPTDSQFQELLKTQQLWNAQRMALDKQFQNDPSSSAYTDQLNALDASRDQEYRRVLGDAAFDTLQKEQDSSYTQMKKFEALWGLDDASIDSVYSTLKYYQKNVADYQARARALDAEGQNVDWGAVNKNLQQFSDQIQQTLQNYLGRSRFDKMMQNGVFQLSPPDMTGHVKPAQ